MSTATYTTTAGDLARDAVTYSVAAAYSRLLSTTRADLVAFLAGPRNAVEAHRVAECVVATTADADLVPLIARLLMGADTDEAVEAAAYGIGAVCSAAANSHPLRRSYDKTEG